MNIAIVARHLSFKTYLLLLVFVCPERAIRKMCRSLVDLDKLGLSAD
jgi:hypothetical protein